MINRSVTPGKMSVGRFRGLSRKTRRRYSRRRLKTVLCERRQSKNAMDDKHKCEVEEGGGSPLFLGMTTLKVLFCAALIGVALVSLIRTHSQTLFPSTPPAPAGDLAERWLDVVRKGDEKTALTLAAMLVPDDAPQMPRSDYIKLAVLNGMGTTFLTAPFNHFDYARWRNALFAANLAKRCLDLKNGATPEERIFRSLIRELRIGKSRNFEAEPRRGFFEVVLKNGEASPPEWFLIYAEAVFQSGAEVMVVSLFDKGSVVHAVCEIRGKDGSKSVADPLKGCFWAGVDTADLAADPTRLKGVWSEREIAALHRRAYKLPAEPMDYRLFEQRLRGETRSLHSLRFGIDPQKRIERYIARFIKSGGGDSFTYWRFPFRVLKADKAFPQDWQATKAIMEVK